ncbi:MAG TPA: TolC family protein [Spirochaetota bacterium]|nr:TolC family protein [Spirochaetota bacterium]HPS86383.1 TolC family protein [Spirochaetota bacterium]
MNKHTVSLLFVICLTSASVSAAAGDDIVNEKTDQKFLKLDIRSSVSIAVANSFELQEIRAKEGLYDLAIDEKLRSYFPSLTFSYMQTDEVRKRDSDSRSSRLSIESEFPIYDGGKRSLDYDIAKLNALLARNDYRISANKLIASVREGYLNLLKLRETIKIIRITLEHGMLQLQFIRKEFELGDATKLSVIEIEAKIKEIELALKQAADEYETALNQYKLLLRINRHTPVEIDGDLDKDFVIIPAMAINVEEFVSIALKMKKEIESSTAKYEISMRNNEMSENYFLPNVSLGLNYNLNGEEYPPKEKGWGVNIKFSTRILGNTISGGTGYNEGGNGNSKSRSGNSSADVLNDMPYKSTLVESRIEMAKANDELAVMKDSIAAEIVSLCAGIINSWDMIGIASKQVELYDAQLIIERLKADMGESRRYDLLEKEIDRGKAAVALLNSKIKYLMSASNLELSTGMDVGFLRNYIKSKE